MGNNLCSLLVFLLLLASAFLQAGNQPIVIPIQNPSFEQFTAPLTHIDPCGLEERTLVNFPAWKFVAAPGSGGAGGLLKPNGESTNTKPNGCNVPLPPDGQMVAFAQSTTISQDLGSSPSVDGVYTLTFYVANYFYWYGSAYSASIVISKTHGSYGDTVHLCSTSGYAMGDFTKVTMTCPNQRFYGDLTISLSAPAGPPNWPVLFDDVTLEFTPQ